MFYLNLKTSSGLLSHCRPCVALNNQRMNERNVRKRESQQPKAVKRCTKCKQLLPSRCFHASKGTKDGLKYLCIVCSKENFVARNRERSQLFGAHPPSAPPGKERICLQCKAIKPWSEFRRTRQSLYGIMPLCLQCQRINGQLARQYKALEGTDSSDQVSS